MRSEFSLVVVATAFCVVVALSGTAHSDSLISSFNNFTSDALYNSWNSATIVSGPDSYSVTATGYGSNYKYIGLPGIIGAGNADLELMINLSGPPAADGELGPIVDLIDGDGTRYSYRWYGQTLGSHLLSSPVESPYSVISAGSTAGLNLNTLTHMHMQLDPGGLGTSGAYTVEWENLNLTGFDPDPGQDPYPNPEQPKVYMHYMPWFETPDTLGPNQWGYHWKFQNQNPNIVDSEGRRQIASHFYPKIGPYASSDPDVIEYHLLSMKMAGVDGVLIDWYGVQGANGDVGSLLINSNALIDKVDDFGLEFGVVLEDRFSTTAIGNGVPDINKAKSNVAYLRDNYFNNPQYIRMGTGNDPLLLNFGPITFDQESQWSQILAEAGGDVAFATLWGQSGKAGTSADGEYAWPTEDEALDNYFDLMEAFYQGSAPNLTVSGGLAFPGFVDFYQEGGVGEVVNFKIPHDNGQTLANTLNLASQYSSDFDFIQLATWNDFGEGTIIEPTVETGFKYLEQLQEFTGVPYGEAELQLVFDLYRARKEFSGNPAMQALLDQASAHLAALEIADARAIIEAIYLPGDFDGDGEDNGLDFLAWQRQAGSTGLYPLNTLAADGNGDGVVDGKDLAIWESHYGWVAPLGAASTVPEPASAVLLGSSVIAGFFTRRRHG